MATLLTIIIFLAAILLILVVLMQPGKGDMISGLSGIGGQFNSMFGTRKTMNFLSKATMVLAATIFVLSLLTNKFFISNEVQVQKAVTEDVDIPTQTIPAAPPATVPELPPAEEEK